MTNTVSLTGGEAIVAMLRRFGVEMMFGLPGDQTDIYDALHRDGSVRHVLVRHEQAAAHMADAYARATGRVGVCDASIGPGATNLISGIAEAFTSGIPVIALVSAVRSEWTGRGCFQEIDQVEVFRPITKWSVTVDATSRIPELMARAFRVATTGRPGPVLLSFPIDVLKGEHPFGESDLAVDARHGHWPPERPSAPDDAIIHALDTLAGASKPVILAGGGVHASGAAREVIDLAERLDLPVATTYMGKGSVPENHPLSLGPFGLIGRPATNEYVMTSDVALALGTRFTNVDTAAWRVPGPDTRIVQVDIDPTQLGRNLPIELGLTGDLKAVLRQLLDQVTARGVAAPNDVRSDAVRALTSTWRVERGIDSSLAQDDAASPVHPLQVIRALRATMAADDTIVCDSGFNQIWGGQCFEVHSPGRRYLGPRGSGVMGFSFPAAISLALAQPDRRVVALCGDGGFAMVIQELETALRLGANVTVCIMNNSNLQYIRENQRLLFDSRFQSTDFSDVDFAAIATAFGCLGIRVESSGELESALSTALASDRPAVVDVRTLPDAVPDRMSFQALD